MYLGTTLVLRDVGQSCMHIKHSVLVEANQAHHNYRTLQRTRCHDLSALAQLRASDSLRRQQQQRCPQLAHQSELLMPPYTHAILILHCATQLVP